MEIKKIILASIFVASYLTFVLINKPKQNTYLQTEVKSSGVLSGAIKKDGNPFIEGKVAENRPNGVGVEIQAMHSVLPINKVPDQQSPLVPASIDVDYSSGQNTFFQLDSIAQSDERPENRLAAVNALRDMLHRSDLDKSTREGIKETLRIASTDGDPRVADVAHDAYQQLSK